MQAAMTDFRVHMLQHLLIGMLAPLGLVLGAPMCLLLRRLPPRSVRTLVGLLHGAWIQGVSHPCVALVLNVGGLYLLYLTPLYTAMHASLPLHALVHLHVVLAGCLFTWSILNGPDPVPQRYTMRLRLTVLFIGIAAHTMLSKLMYAHGLPAGAHSLEQIQQGAKWMYYGGDLVELLLLIALFARWHRCAQTAKMRARIQ
jgi:putative membrane protein